MIKFCKIFAKAEWKLKNLRRLDDIKDVTEYLRTVDEDSNNIDVQSQPNENTSIQEKSTKTIKVGSREMTEEEYRQYQEIQRLIPEIDWGADAMFTGYETQCASTVPVALR